MVGAALPADVEGGGQAEGAGLEAKGGTNFLFLLAETAEGAWERFMALKYTALTPHYTARAH